MAVARLLYLRVGTLNGRCRV